MNTKNRKRLFTAVLVMMLAVSLVAVGCSNSGGTKEPAKKKIVLAGSTWESAKVNAEIMAFIITNGYGYETEIVSASSMIELVEHGKGGIDIRAENWTKSYGDEYYEPVKNGSILEVNEILKENAQGLYIPRYMIEGDAARGIAAATPGLQKLTDLPKYWEVLKDPEDPKKGRIYGAPNDWSTNAILVPMLKNLKVDQAFNLFMPGSGTALDAAIAGAYEKGQPIVAYYWEPTWLLGMYDMVKLEMPAFDQAKWDAKSYDCDFPADKVTITVHKDLPPAAPDIVDMLKKYTMTSSEMNSVLAYMQKNNAEPKATAIKYLQDNADTWSKWISKEAADKVAVALK